VLHGKQPVVKHGDHRGSARMSCVCGYDSEVNLEFEKSSEKIPNLKEYTTEPLLRVIGVK